MPEEPAAFVAVRINATPPRDGTGERALPRVAKGRMAQVVSQCDRLGKVLVQPERRGHAAGNLGDLERVREPRAVVVALRGEKDLRLVREPAKRLAVDDAVSVALIARAKTVGLLRREPTDRGVGERRERREQLMLPPLGV